jgi:hypothetical protein
MLLNGVAGPIDGYGVLMCRLVLGWTEGPSLVGLPLSSHKSKRDVVQCLITTPSDELRPLVTVTTPSDGW